MRERIKIVTPTGVKKNRVNSDEIRKVRNKNHIVIEMRKMSNIFKIKSGVCYCFERSLWISVFCTTKGSSDNNNKKDYRRYK